MAKMFVAVGTSGVIRSSPDGITWTVRSSTTSPLFNAVAWGGGKWVAVASDGVHTSTDGTAWSRTTTTPTDARHVAYGNGTWVAIDGSSNCYTSSDAATWTAGDPLTGVVVRGVEFANGVFLAFGSFGKISRSTDGETWTPVTSGTSEHINGMARHETLGRWLGVCDTYEVLVYSDDDGLTWTATSPNYTAFFPEMSDVAYGDGKFVAIGDTSSGDPCFNVSADGLTWGASGSGDWISASGTAAIAVTYADGTWVAIDAAGAAASSPDGSTWTKRGAAGGRDVYGAVLNVAPNAPLVSDQGTFDRSSVNRVTWTFSDPDTGDSQSAAELRYRESGTSTWTTVNIGNPNQFWDSPAGTFVADLYEAQVKTADQAGVWGPFSASFFITAGDAPAGPTWLDPTNGQTIGTSAYTFKISAPNVDESELRLVADDGTGQPDESTILHGPFSITTGNLREHTVEGLANNVPVHPQWRVEDDGLWSQWATIRVEVSYTPPPDPTVTYTQVPEEAAVDITVTNPAPGVGEPAVSYLNIEIRDPGEGWERRATMLAPNSTWRYWTPVSGWDPGANIRVTAVAENSTTATTEGATEA